MSDIYDMNKVPKFEFNLGRVTFVSEESPYIVMGNLVDPKESIKQLRVNISDAAKIHQRMYYTTDVATMSLIFSKMTLRSSSLTYAKLNDKKEKERVGISQFAASRFITCFSHINHESVAFWTNYGGTVREKKVLLKFKNFAPHIFIIQFILIMFCLAETKEYFSTLMNITRR